MHSRSAEGGLCAHTPGTAAAGTCHGLQGLARPARGSDKRMNCSKQTVCLVTSAERVKDIRAALRRRLPQSAGLPPTPPARAGGAATRATDTPPRFQLKRRGAERRLQAPLFSPCEGRNRAKSRGQSQCLKVTRSQSHACPAPSLPRLALDAPRTWPSGS